ncbi:AraC family transcriptional regulator [Nesterenkonia muleiensis]|uniref:AraC family transcriptional regulator n=1 Tax=Nesterenkonia muleiensis TaxID=2282648 RepID=UPI000E76FCE9|nr:helix-turn-helix domain-containing protein [Nesterenkonia muleiensis]
MAGEQPFSEFVQAPPRGAPGVISMLGYRAHGLPESVHRGLPSSALTFILAFDEGVQAAATAPALASATPAKIVLGGLHTTTAFVQQRSDWAGIEITVHPLAARSLFGVPTRELSVTDFDGSSLLQRWGEELHGRAVEARDWAAAFAHVESRLIRQFDGHLPVRPELLHAWQLLERTGGRMPISALARQVTLTPRHLGTLFQREVGLSPKAVAGLIRFSRTAKTIADQLRWTGQPDLAQIASDTGYADQAHLSREFSRYAGISPRAWMAEEFRNIQDGGHSTEAY